jgi:hypothetical protein
MSRWFSIVLAAPLWVAAFAPTASAQAPKPGPYYEETNDIGFKIKVPDGWEFIPASPEEGNAIGSYEPKVPKYINIGPNESLFINCWLLVFDRRESSKQALERKLASPDIKAWLDRTPGAGNQLHQISAEPATVDKIPCVEYLYEGKSPQTNYSKGGVPVYLYAMLYKVEPDIDIAIAFNTPAEKKDWGKWKGPLSSMAKSFKRLKVEKLETRATGPGGASSLRDKKRASLQADMAKSPGWQLYETPNYFIVSNNPDKAFLEELERRLEGVREVYEKDYPIEKALEARKAMAARGANGRDGKHGADGQDGENGQDGGAGAPADDHTTRSADSSDPMEASRTSVVRVCLNEDQYHSYGGPNGSAGYWNSGAEELVVYDDKAQGGRGDTWITLNHEAFHQYIYYFYGSIAPHSWYNEGTGDYYSGYQINGRGKFELERNDWRLRTIQQNVRDSHFAPLKELVRWSQPQYYGNNEYHLEGGDNYAQGWAFVYFLRTGQKGKAKGWDPAWNKILDVYLETLAATGDLDQSVDKAFAGVDWTAMEESWKEYTQR